MMRATTLKAPSGGVGGLVAYYGGLSSEAGPAKGPVDYYLDPNEPPGRWWGTGCAALDLGGEVDGRDLGLFLDASSPSDGSPLGRPFDERSARAYDATFSAPKSVSVLWAITPDPWVRAEVLASHDQAVEAALGWLEQHGCVSRRGHDGTHQVDGQGLTVALFRQHTSRTIDPQLHTHAVISSKVQDPTGRWLSLDARFLMKQQRSISWIYDAALRAELTGRLGVEWGEVVGGQADLVAIPEQVRDAFSSRTDQVQWKRAELVARWTAEHDGAAPDVRTLATLERRAVLSSRPGKTSGISAAELHGQWTEQAQQLGLALNGLTGPSLPAQAIGDVWLDRWGLVEQAIERVEQESSTWLPADLSRQLATLLPPHAVARAEDVVALVEDMTTMAVEQCVELTPDRGGPTRRDGRSVLEHVIDHRLTSPHVLEQEQHLQEWAACRSYSIEASDDPQRAAADAIAGSARLVLVVGPAGTGKTTATAWGVESLVTQGRQVVGLAPSGKAADVLRAEAGCPAETLASFLLREEDPTSDSRWRPGTTVLVDEAGMAATADIAQLAGLANRHHWRVVAIGDPAQLPAVGRGGVFEHWCETLPHYELADPRRFREAWEADASLALRRGDREAALRYEEHGRLHAVPAPVVADQAAALHATLVKEGKEVALTTTSRSTALDINRAIQARANHPEHEPSAPLGDGSVVYDGDRIATRLNDRSLETDLGRQVRNRQTWTVEVVQPDGGLVVSHDERGRVELPPSYVERQVELGWAVTGYGVQGDTVDVGLAVVEPGTSRNQLYVAMTRGRDENHALVVDDEPSNARDGFEAAMTRSIERGSALGVAMHLHRDAGLLLDQQALGRSLEQGLGIGLER